MFELDEINKNISKNMKYIRKNEKLSQSDISKKINVSLSTYQRMESNPIYYPLSSLIRIATALDCRYIDFIVEQKITNCDNECLYNKIE